MNANLKAVALRRMSLYKLFKADNPDEYAEIIVPRNREAISEIKSRRFFESRGKENFGISIPRNFEEISGTLPLKSLGPLGQAISKGESGYIKEPRAFRLGQIPPSGL